MTGDLSKLAACAVASVIAHAAFARALELLPEQPPRHEAKQIVVRVVEPPRQPPPEPVQPTPEPAPTTPPQTPPKPIPHVAPPRVASAPTPPTATPPAEHPPTTGPPSDEPVFGVSMESTSQAGTGPAVPIGSSGGSPTGGGSAAPPPGPTKTAAEPVPEYAVTSPPLPQGRCSGKYTDDAKAAGIEGTVVLDLVIGEDGTVRDIQVTSKLGHGLDQAAVAALRACRFSPGEKDGQRVAVRVRGFKIRFVLSDAP
jgi:periplasmic protein TonB